MMRRALHVALALAWPLVASPVRAVPLVARVDTMAQPKTGHTACFDDLEVYALGD